MNQKGFTIVELMAATVVFSVMLLIVTFALLRIGQVYYKGLNSSRIQDVTRSVIDEVSQAIQLSDGNIVYIEPRNPGDKQAYCIGNRYFVFRHGVRQEDAGAAAAVLESYSGSASCEDGVEDIENLGNARTLLGENMRILEFSITNFTSTPGISVHRLNVSIAYGTDDLIDFDEGRCHPGFGSQFCAVSDLRTVVTSRL